MENRRRTFNGRLWRPYCLQAYVVTLNWCVWCSPFQNCAARSSSSIGLKVRCFIVSPPHGRGESQIQKIILYSLSLFTRVCGAMSCQKQLCCSSCLCLSLSELSYIRNWNDGTMADSEPNSVFMNCRMVTGNVLRTKEFQIMKKNFFTLTQ